MAILTVIVKVRPIPPHGGFYAQVVNKRTLAVLHTTLVYADARDAKHAAELFVGTIGRECGRKVSRRQPMAAPPGNPGSALLGLHGSRIPARDGRGPD